MPWVIAATGDGNIVTLAWMVPGSAPARSKLWRAPSPRCAVPEAASSIGKPRGATRIVRLISSDRPRPVSLIDTSALASVATTSSGKNRLCLSCALRWIAPGALAVSLNAEPNCAASVASIGSSVSLVSVTGSRTVPPEVTSTGRWASSVIGSLAWNVVWPPPGAPAAEKPSAVARNAVTASDSTNDTSASPLAVVSTDGFQYTVSRKSVRGPS